MATEYLAHLAEIVRAMEAGALGATSLRSAAIDRESAFSKFYGQATKGVRWMPWRREAMKDVAGCDKPR